MSKHVELPHEAEMVFQAHRLAVGGMGTKLMIEDMHHIHSSVPQRGSFNRATVQPAIDVDLAKFMVAIELLDGSQLATPSVREEEGDVVKIRAYCRQVAIGRSLEAAESGTGCRIDIDIDRNESQRVIG